MSRRGPVRRSLRNNPGAAVTDNDHVRQASTGQRTHSHVRTFSNATHATSIRSTSTKRARQKYHIRQSLLGPNVKELTIDSRAQMVAAAAGDCLIKLLRAGLEGEPRRRDSERAGWKQSWESFQTLRRSSMFLDTMPPFALYTDIFRELDPGVQGRLNLKVLKRAVELSDITHFVYAILQPDLAGDLLPAPPSSRSRKGKEKADTNVLSATVSRRNAVFLKAWESYWLVIVPREQRDKELPLRLWLDFATQIFITFQHPSITNGDGPDPTLPPPPDDLLEKLFSPLAIAKYGQWESNTGFESDDSGIEGMEQKIVEERWAKAMRKREKELRTTKLETLGRRYPYEVFLKNMLSYVETDVLGTGVHLSNQAIELVDDSEADEIMSSGMEDIKSSRSSPRKVMLPRRSTGRQSLPSFHSHLIPLPDMFYPSDSDARSQQSGYLPTDEEHDMAAAEASIGEQTEEEDEDQVDGPLELDLLAELAREMEENAQLVHQENTFGDAAVDDEDDQWAVRDGGTPRISLLPRADGNPLFTFGARQNHAERVEWESQSQASETPRRAAGNASHRLRNSATPQPATHRESADIDATPKANNLVGRTPFAPLDLQEASISATRYSVPPSPFVRNSASVTPERPLHQEELGAQEESLFADADEEAEEEIEVIENPDFTVEDLLPDTNQMLGDRGGSSEGPRTPIDVDIGDLMPRSSQLVSDDSPHQRSQDDQVIVIGGDDEDISIPVPENLVEPAKIPTSQRLLGSTRPRRSGDALEFAQPDEEEDEEDRQLLQNLRERTASRAADPPRESSIHSSPAAKRSPSPIFMRAVRGRSVTGSMTADDPYLFDVDGSALAVDDNYIIPLDHASSGSRIHGRRDGQSSSYSRITGRRRWTKAEELLLYRTVQKVPLSEEYPLRVAWYLHGEFGTLSHDLEQFNPQHMKDKMRVIVDVRLNNRKPIVGRARYWLPKNHPLRLAYDEEVVAWKREQQKKYDEEIARVEEAKKKKAESRRRKRRGRGEESESESEDENADEADGAEGDEDEGEAEGASEPDEQAAEGAESEDADELESEEGDTKPNVSPRVTRRSKNVKAPLSQLGPLRKKRTARVNISFSPVGATAEHAKTSTRRTQPARPSRAGTEDEYVPPTSHKRKAPTVQANSPQPRPEPRAPIPGPRAGTRPTKRPPQVVEVEIAQPAPAKRARTAETVEFAKRSQPLPRPRWETDPAEGSTSTSQATTPQQKSRAMRTRRRYLGAAPAPSSDGVDGETTSGLVDEDAEGEEDGDGEEDGEEDAQTAVDQALIRRKVLLGA